MDSFCCGWQSGDSHSKSICFVPSTGPARAEGSHTELADKDGYAQVTADIHKQWHTQTQAMTNPGKGQWATRGVLVDQQGRRSPSSSHSHGQRVVKAGTLGKHLGLHPAPPPPTVCDLDQLTSPLRFPCVQWVQEWTVLTSQGRCEECMVNSVQCLAEDLAHTTP